jgi:hypothetical protein
VRDRRGGRDGEDCFVDAHLITLPSFVSHFTTGPVEYRGYVMQYATSFFLRGRQNAKDCATARSRGPVIAMFSSARGSGSLSLERTRRAATSPACHFTVP